MKSVKKRVSGSTSSVAEAVNSFIFSCSNYQKYMTLAEDREDQIPIRNETKQNILQEQKTNTKTLSTQCNKESSNSEARGREDSVIGFSASPVDLVSISCVAFALAFL